MSSPGWSRAWKCAVVINFIALHATSARKEITHPFECPLLKLATVVGGAGGVVVTATPKTIG